MVTRTIVHMFDRYEDAAAAVSALEAAGFSHDDVSLVANQGASTAGVLDPAGNDPVTHSSGAATGAGLSIGTIIGGGAGLLAGIGALAIPGIGPIVAAGWLVAALTGAGVGAAAGGLLGSLTAAGVSEEHAHVYAEGVRRGGSLVTVRTDETRAAQVDAILAQHGAIDVGARSADYRADPTWAGFDDGRPAMSPAEIEAERARLSSQTLI